MTTAFHRVLELLYDRGGGFVAAGELSTSAKLSAVRLERLLDELRVRGFRVESSPAHGMRLVHPVPLDAHLIERGLGTSRIGRNVICFEEVDSTNDVAFDASRQKHADGLVVLAEHQRKGRGRHGHKWLSPPGTNILMSVLLVDTGDRHGPEHGQDARATHGHDAHATTEAVTIAAGLAVAEGVEAACGAPCAIHWPNDVCVEGTKISGVLMEARKRGAASCLIIGIGVNCNASPPPGRTDKPATDLAAHVGGPVERIEVVRAVLRRLDHWVGRVRDGRLAELHDEWVVRCGILNRRLAVLSAGRKYVGRVLDVSPLEGMVLRCDQDVTVHLSAQTSSIVE